MPSSPGSTASAPTAGRFGGVTSGLGLDLDGRLHPPTGVGQVQKGCAATARHVLKHKGLFETDDSAEDPFAFSPGT